MRLKSKTGGWLVHPDLRDRMIQEAEAEGTNLTDLAVRILSSYFGVPYEPTQRKSTPEDEKEILNFGVHPDLKSAIVRAYPQAKWTDTIRVVLCGHYGLAMPDRIKYTRNRTPAAA